MNMLRNAAIFTVVVGAFEKNLAIFKYLKQFVDLNGMKLTNLINKKNPAVSLGDGTGFRLGIPAMPSGPAPW